MMNKAPALYVHVPFCAHICHYCDFCHRIYNEDVACQWLDALKKEIAEEVDFHPSSLYLGGGTPTVLSSELFAELLKTLHPFSGREFTVEVNPETLDREKTALLKQYGVNRISIGMQSSDDEELLTLGRHHRFSDTKQTVKMLQEEGIDNISLDIMYSFPTQTMATFRQTIRDALSLNPKHLSLYSLTVEEHTVFYSKGVQPFDEDREAEYYEYAVNTFKKNGFRQYEVANFCLPGYESEHNLAYWHYDDFLGVSLSAASKMDNERFTNTTSFKDYLSGNRREETIVLSREDSMFEMLMMNLRLEEGLSKKRFFDKYRKSVDDVYKQAVEDGLAKGWIWENDDFIGVCNREILNSVLLLFMR